MRSFDPRNPFSRACGVTRGSIHTPVRLAQGQTMRAVFVPGPGTCFTDLAATMPAGWGDAVAHAGIPAPGYIQFAQAEAADRPILGRHPVTGIRNLLADAPAVPNSENFGLWGGPATREEVAGKGPFAQGWKITDSDPAGSPQISNTIPVPAGQAVVSYYISFDADDPPSTGVSTFSLQGGSDSAAVRVNWDGAGGIASVQSSSGSTEAVGFDDLGDGLFRVWARDTFAGGDYSTFGWPASFDPTGTPTGSVILYGCQIERSAAGPSAYQRVGSAFEVTEAGQLDLPYLWGDGLSKHMVSTVDVDLTTYTAAAIFAAAQKLDDTDAFVLASLGGAAARGIEIFKAAELFRWGVRTIEGASTIAANATNALAPDTAVITGIVDRAGNSARLRYNGELSESSTMAMTGAMASASFSILARSDGSQPFLGRLYAVGLAGGVPDDAALASAEANLLRRIGVAP